MNNKQALVHGVLESTIDLRSVFVGYIHFKNLSIKNVGQNYLKKHLNYAILVKYCVMAISRNSNCFLIRIERRLSQKIIVNI